MSGEKRYFWQDADGNMVAFDDTSICIHKNREIVRILVDQDAGIDVLIEAIKDIQNERDMDCCL